MKGRDQNMIPLQFSVGFTPELESSVELHDSTENYKRFSKEPPDLKNKISNFQGQDGILISSFFQFPTERGMT